MIPEKNNIPLPVKDSLSRLEQLYQTAPVGLCFVDTDFRFLRINDILAAIHGYPVEAHLGRTVREIFPALADRIEPVLSGVIESGKGLKNVDFACKQLTGPEGVAHWRVSYHPVHDEDGGILGVSVVVQDITDLRLKECALDEHARFEQQVAHVSSRFVNLPVDQVDSCIEEALGAIGESLATDLGTLLLFDPDRQQYHVTHEWLGTAAPTGPAFKDLYVDEGFPWLARALVKRVPLFIHSIDQWPDEASIERATCEQVGIKSVLWVPFEAGAGDQVQGYVALNTLREKRTWSDNYIQRLRLVGEIFGNALLRKQSAQKLRSAFDRIAELKDRLESENQYLRDVVETQHGHNEIIGESKAIKRILVQAEQVAATDSTVLLVGETGTGKELLARAIHQLSNRSDHQMVVVNCGALPATLIEAELFGREKGAYTGALSRQIGRFELADKSTLFLDEIGELNPELQIRLLRVLQDGTFERLGGTRTIRVDVRVIAATNRDLAVELRNGRFREDLFYRLNVFPINVIPLRERREDIPLLVWSFVKELSQKMGKSIERIPVEVMEKLQCYSWPGNVRELRNVIERALIVARDETLRVDLPADTIEPLPQEMSLDAVERNHIERVLDQTNCQIAGKSGAAEILGIKPTTLRSRMQRLGIPTRNSRGH